MVDSGEYQTTEWQNRQGEVNATWKSFRQYLMRCLLEINGMNSENRACDTPQCTNPSSIKCIDCTGAFLCSECDDNMHAVNPCHDRLMWVEDHYEHCKTGMCIPINGASFVHFLYDIMQIKEIDIIFKILSVFTNPL